jgi:3-ketosteroid 9alpha-monooxygenase subunit A
MSSIGTDPDPYEGFPRGWFAVRFSDEVKPGDVIPMKYFGKDLVLFRTASGQPQILDAYCPHLGAHLGHGGKVDGEDLECPFHAWKFNGKGECTDVPYAKKIPPKAKIACWPVSEVNGIIFVWHDRYGTAPSFEIPPIPDLETGELLAWDHSCLEIATHPREIVENVADLGHFMPVHGTDVDPASFRNEYDGHMATQINKGVAYPLGGGEDPYELRATYYGPGYQLTRLNGVANGLLVNAHTPIDQNRLHLRFAVSLKVTGDRNQTERFMSQYIDNLRRGFLQDVQIWEHKVFRDKPVLCDGDGPIGQLRRWHQQFYGPPARVSGAAAE